MTLLLSLTMMLPFAEAGKGKGPCDGVKLAEDPFTHQKTASVRGHSSHGPGYEVIWWNANLSGDATTLKLEIALPGVHQEVLPGGYKVLFLLEDQTILEFASGEPASPTSDISRDSQRIATFWTVTVPVEKSVAAQLARQPLVGIRTPLPGGDVNWGMQKDEMATLTRAFNCYVSLTP